MNTVFWLGIMVVFLIVEAVTPVLVSVWFSLGALVAGIGAYFGLGDTACVLLFVVVSGISLVVFKRFYKKSLAPVHQPTNADRLIGAVGVVESDIDPIKAKGTVEVQGSLWSAKAENPIEKGTTVKVCAIEGVKLLVKEM